MPAGVRTRLAGAHDAAALCHLEEVAFTTDRFTREQIEYLLSRSRASTFVLEERGSVIGGACVLWRRSKQAARLYNIAIDPACQGRGYGAVLLDECEHEASRRGCERITLEVRQDNTNGIRFYEKRGYVTIRAVADYYSDGTTALKMSKQLPPARVAELRLNVPYHAQTLGFTCGPACLMMALKFFQPELELTRALEMTLWKEATLIFMAAGFGGTDGHGLALSATVRGLNCRLVQSMDSTPMLKSVRSDKKREVMRIVHHDLRRKARRAGVASSTYEYGIEELVSALHRRMLPVAMISTYRLTGDRVPHWVVVTGFDDKHVYIHDPDIASYKRNRSRARHIRIEKSEFLRMSRYGKEVYRCLLLLAPGGSTASAGRR